jgi:hypothetical protein
MSEVICPETKKPCTEYACEQYNRFIGCMFDDGPKREEFIKAHKQEIENG